MVGCRRRFCLGLALPRTLQCTLLPYVLGCVLYRRRVVSQPWVFPCLTPVVHLSCACLTPVSFFCYRGIPQAKGESGFEFVFVVKLIILSLSSPADAACLSRRRRCSLSPAGRYGQQSPRPYTAAYFLRAMHAFFVCSPGSLSQCSCRRVYCCCFAALCVRSGFSNFLVEESGEAFNRCCYIWCAQ